MPVTINTPKSLAGPSSRIRPENGGARATRASASSGALSIGLVNNMPDSALEATERQFVALLKSASEGMDVELSFFALPGISRGESAQRRINQLYPSTDSLKGKQLDAVIVTGREPLSANLREEPYWESFVELLEWARRHTHSAIWSCLAAHAAVLHMDGIERVRSEQKNFGVFNCTRVSNHPITANIPVRSRVPHSRWNGLPEGELKRCGYQALTRIDGAGVDSFVKKDHSLFVFFQGHWEYQTESLMLEYRRDVNRYLAGEAQRYPGLPQGYFDAKSQAELADIQLNSSTRSVEETSLYLEAALSGATLTNGWRETATTIYRNWLQYLSVQRILQGQDEAIAKQPVASGEGHSVLREAVGAAGL